MPALPRGVGPGIGRRERGFSDGRATDRGDAFEGGLAEWRSAAGVELSCEIMTPGSCGHRLGCMGRVSIAVAIIEDDAPAREILAQWLRRAEGFRCVGEYESAETALRELPGVKPDVVLVDINLPGLNGIECVRRLKPQMPEAQFVMLTVYEDADHIFDALKAGATGYLLKQTTRQELLAAVRQVHSGGSPMTSNIARKVVQSFQQKPAGLSAGAVEAPETAELSPREREVLDLLARGYLYKEIADALSISLPTVNTYIRRIYEKLHVRSRWQAVARYAHWAPGAGGADRGSEGSGGRKN